MPNFRRPGANVGQPNQLATLVLISVASLVYLFETRRLSSLAALPMAAILLLGLAVTESRTGALSLFLMAVWWMAMRRRIGLSLSVRAAALWILFFVVCLWYAADSGLGDSGHQVLWFSQWHFTDGGGRVGACRIEITEQDTLEFRTFTKFIQYLFTHLFGVTVG